MSKDFCFKLFNLVKKFIISHCQHRSSWPSLATSLYCPLLPGGLPGYILISTELLYIGSSRLSCLCLSLWRGPQEYITYKFILISPAVSHWFIKLGSFSWWVVGGCTTAVLWGVASRTCSIQLTAFLCNCHQAFSPYV